MKKLLFPIEQREYYATMGRICYLLNELSRHFVVEVLTITKEVYEDINKKIDGTSPNIHARLLVPDFLPVTYDLRNDLAKIFIQYTYDLVIPGSELKIWKTTAIDDFWGHIAGHTFPEIAGIDADMVLLPLMSFDEAVPEDADVFYTTFLFNSKEAGITVAGYQLYPVFEGNPLMPRLVDALIVRKEYERQFYINHGIDAEKIWLLTNERDIYSASTVEDTYKNKLYNSRIEVDRSELGIVVVNHARFRPQIREVFRVIRETGLRVVLMLLKRQYTIREWTEDKIIEEVFFEDIRKINCRFYLVEPESVANVVMISDVIISPSYIMPLEFAAQNGKNALVYNPLNGPMPAAGGVSFINSPGDLAQFLKEINEKKRAAVGMLDIIKALSGRKA